MVDEPAHTGRRSTEIIYSTCSEKIKFQTGRRGRKYAQTQTGR
jgi:hypothetical protein